MSALASRSDTVLVQRSCAGDPDAFAVLVGRHRPMVLRVARALVGPAAEDVAQQTFLSAWLGLGRFDEARGSLPTWLGGIARNRAIDVLRSESRRAPVASMDELAELACPAAGPADEVHRRVSGAAVRRALATLGPEQRTAITLAYFGGLSQREIHARTDTPIGTVKGRVRLGLVALRRELGVAA